MLLAANQDEPDLHRHRHGALRIGSHEIDAILVDALGLTLLVPQIRLGRVAFLPPSRRQVVRDRLRRAEDRASLRSVMVENRKALLHEALEPSAVHWSQQ